ncbi:MAG TPA: FAD-dependent monooxygenase [Candidatus Dormibacteraeota bacterium]|nr:FAD-dependent monooxygenase [Candidatus Dormibacteraeota bacterium]
MKAPTGGFDVGIVGYGPVGQLTAALLGRAGHRVVVFEHWPSLFPYPKAGHLDDEVIRILQSVGAAGGVVAGSWPMTGCDLLHREGKVLVALDWNVGGRSGWHSDYSAYQPNLEPSSTASSRPNRLSPSTRAGRRSRSARTASGQRSTLGGKARR